jgi:precorrin-6B methylase 2
LIDELFINSVRLENQSKIVSWLAKNDLNAKVQELLRNHGTVTQFKHPIAKEKLDSLLSNKERFIRK